MTKIMVLGSINMDIVARTAHHPIPGETVMGHDLQYFPGGKGSNQAVAASRLFADVYLIGKLGQDAFGNSLHRFLQQQNLNLAHLKFTEADPTGIALIVLNEQSENTIVVISGSNHSLSLDDLADIHPTAGDIVVSQFEVPQPVIYELFQHARTQGAVTILNTAPAAPFHPGLLPLVDYLILNESELVFFAKSDAPLLEQARAIRASDQQKIVVTLGAKGSVCINGDEVITVPSFPVQAVDTTGAGDCFVGTLAAGLAVGKNLRDTLTFANAAAALSVQKAGASTSMPTTAEVETFLKEQGV